MVPAPDLALDQVAPDDLLHDLVRPTVDALDARVHEGTGNWKLGHVAVAAVQLDAGVDDLPLHLGGPPLGLRGIHVGEQPGIERSDAAVDITARYLYLGTQLGEGEPDSLKFGDGLAEGA